VVRTVFQQMVPRERLEPTELILLLKAVEDVTNPLVTVCERLWEPADVLPHTASFTVGATVAALLQDNLLPLPEQRLVAIYILYDLIISRLALRQPLSLSFISGPVWCEHGTDKSVTINASKITRFSPTGLF
jgi:hypothetical protein